MTRFTAVTSHIIKQLDAVCIDEIGVPGLVLMENAGCAVALEIISKIKKSRRFGYIPSILVVCGKGNNGADGIVCARHLMAAGYKVLIALINFRPAKKTAVYVQYDITKKLGGKCFIIRSSYDFASFLSRHKPCIIVDAIFGVGFKGKAQGIFKDCIEHINASGAYTVSIDVPSGLDASLGTIGGYCVNADLTVTMGLPKKGLYIKQGKQMSGKVVIAHIGMPYSLLLNRRRRRRMKCRTS